MKKSLAQVREDNEGAFTLVELLVVILIIGILAAIAIPAFLNQRKAAVDSAVESDIKNASTQIETWAVSNPDATVTTFTVADTDDDGVADFTPAVTGPLADIKISDGTTLTVTGTGTGTYTVNGTNDGGNRADGADITFDSANGGF